MTPQWRSLSSIHNIIYLLLLLERPDKTSSILYGFATKNFLCCAEKKIDGCQERDLNFFKKAWSWYCGIVRCNTIACSVTGAPSKALKLRPPAAKHFQLRHSCTLPYSMSWTHLLDLSEMLLASAVQCGLQQRRAAPGWCWVGRYQWCQLFAHNLWNIYHCSDNKT